MSAMQKLFSLRQPAGLLARHGHLVTTSQANVRRAQASSQPRKPAHSSKLRLECRQGEVMGLCPELWLLLLCGTMVLSCLLCLQVVFRCSLEQEHEHEHYEQLLDHGGQGGGVCVW